MPVCPRCGANMELRTARRGSHRGNQFYGCPNWRTTCRGVTIDAGRTNQHNGQGDTSSEGPAQLTSVPVVLNARERFRNYRVSFFQNIAVSKEFLDLVNKGEIAREQVEFYGQWRIDLAESNFFEISDREQLVLTTAKKILTRGKVTLLSPMLETSLEKIFPQSPLEASAVDLTHLLCLASTKNESNAWFDGNPNPELEGKAPERYFYEDILEALLGPYYKKFILPQVHFSSLAGDRVINDPTAYQRPDFLITLTPNKATVIELDDPGHVGHEERDENRGRLLAENGINTIRIENEELVDGSGENLQELADLLEGHKIDEITDISTPDKYMLAIKLAYQFQISLIEALLAGHIPFKRDKVTIFFDANSVTFEKKETEAIVKAAFGDVLELLKSIGLLYGVESDMSHISVAVTSKPNDADGILITFDENVVAKRARVVIQDISFPFTIARTGHGTSSLQIAEPNERNLEYFLRYIFRFNSFLEGQFEAIQRALQGKDAIVLLPTGAGKSVAFQLAALVLPGVAIVIDPITALIDDQKDNLLRSGIDSVVGITSKEEGAIRTQMIQAFSRGDYLLCYIAPERMQSDEFRNNLRALTVNFPIALIAIDEAHCVSEWGHNFRTAYLNIGRTTREFCKSHGRVPPLLALTGTASNAVLRDVQRELQIKDHEAIITPKTFDRKELRYKVFECRSDQKAHTLRSIFQTYMPSTFKASFDRFYGKRDKETHCGIVFCPWVNGTYGIIENANVLSGLGIDVKVYAGKPPKGQRDTQWSIDKRQNASDFKNNKITTLAATSAFGMGIDKPNIRYTVHLGLPNSIESFYQEAGRAGRDRKQAQAVLMLSNDFKERTTKLLNPDATTEALNQLIENESDWNTADDVTRALYFHLTAFRGADKELIDIRNIIQKIGSFENARKVNVLFPSGDRNNLEKGVHRLLLLGVISDYTIDYTSNEFRLVLPGITKEKITECYCRYVEGYDRGRVALERSKIIDLMSLPLSEFVHGTAKVLIDFVYGTIEKGRRRAFREMLSLAEEAAKTPGEQDELIRSRILRYLETTYSEEIEKILQEVNSFENLKIIFDGGVTSESGEVIGGIRSNRDAAEVRGQVSRYLESNPDNPGLLFLRGISEAYCKNPDYELVFQNIEAACNFAFNEYRTPKDKLYDILAWILEKVYQRDHLIYANFTDKLIETLDDRQFTKVIMGRGASAAEEMLAIPALLILNRHSKKVVKIFNQ